MPIKLPVLHACTAKRAGIRACLKPAVRGPRLKEDILFELSKKVEMEFVKKINKNVVLLCLVARILASLLTVHAY